MGTRDTDDTYKVIGSEVKVTSNILRKRTFPANDSSQSNIPFSFVFIRVSSQFDEYKILISYTQ